MTRMPRQYVQRFLLALLPLAIPLTLPSSKISPLQLAKSTTMQLPLQRLLMPILLLQRLQAEQLIALN
jgi:hypothetical protein